MARKPKRKLAKSAAVLAATALVEKAIKKAAQDPRVRRKAKAVAKAVKKRARAAGKRIRKAIKTRAPKIGRAVKAKRRKRARA